MTACSTGHRRDEGHLAAVPQRMACGGELPIDGQAKLLRYCLQRRVPGAGSGQRVAGGGAVTDLEDLRRGPRALPGGGEVEDRHAHGAPMVTRLTPEGGRLYCPQPSWLRRTTCPSTNASRSSRTARSVRTA